MKQDAAVPSTQPSGMSARVWRRRPVRAVVYVLAVAIGLRLVLAVSMPYALDRAARTRGLALTYDRLDLSILGGSVELHDLVLRERDAPQANEPLLALDYATLDVAMWKSIFEHPTLTRAEVDGLRARIEITPDGRVPWLSILGIDPSSSEATVADEVTESGAPLSFAAPVQVEALRLHAIELHVRDASIEPLLDARLAADVRLDSASLERHELELRATSSELFDLAHVIAKVDGGERTLAAELRASLSGLRIDPVRARLASLGLDVPAQEISVRSSVEVTANPRVGSERDCEMRVVVHDAALEADGELIAALDRLEAGADSIFFDAPSILDVSITARAPGLAAQLALDGRGELNGNAVDVDFDVRADGVAPSRIAHLLSEMGVVSELEQGRFEARVSATSVFGDAGRVTGSAAIARVRWADAKDLFALDGLTLEGIEFDPAGPKLRVEKIDVAGARTALHRDPAGAWHSMGFASRALDRAPELAPVPAPALDLVISDMGATIESLVLGGEDRASARLRAWVSIADIVDSATIEGTLGASPDNADLEAALAVRVNGLHAVALAPELAPLGIEPTLVQGAMTADIAARVRTSPSDVRLELDLARVALSDGDVVLGALEALHVRDAVLREGGVRVGRVDLEGAKLAVERDVEGRLHALGIRTLPKPPEAPRPSDQATSAWDAVIATFAPLTLPPVAVDVLALKNVQATWFDSAVTPPVRCAVDVRATVESFSTASAKPARFDLVASVPGVLQEASFRGECTLAPEVLALRADARASGVHAGPLATYLPAGIALAVVDGNLELGLEAELRVPEDGPRSARLVAGPFVWRDGGQRFARFDRAALSVTRADAQERVLEIGEVSLAGFELAVERSTPTTWRALGVTVDTEKLASAPPGIVARERAAPAGALRREALPTVKLGSLAVELARVEFTDRSHGDAPPWIGRVKLATPGPLVLLAAEPRELAPFEVAVRAAVEPAIEALEIDLRAAPFRDPIEVELDFAARGLNGAGAMTLAPDLAGTIDASKLTAGELTARATLELDLTRRDPTAFDLTQAFSGRGTLEALHYRAEPGGEVLAGLDAVRAEIARVDPQTGDVAIKTLELEKPIGRVRRTAEGIEVCGLLLRLPGADAASTSEEAPDPRRDSTMHAEPIAASARIESAEQAPAAGSDISLDRLSITGLDFAASDVSVTPPVEIVLDALDVEVRKLSTRDLRAGKPFQFAGAVGAAKLPMPVRVESDSLLEGLTGATIAALAGDQDGATKTEARPFFDEIAFAGRIAVAPKLEGWATVDVSELELTPLAGLAQSFGLSIGDGVLDEALRVRFQGERGMSVDSRACFSHLALTEQAGGPIERYLSLPAPIDTVLFILKDYEGEQKVPVSFRLSESGISGGEIASAAAGAASSVIASAVASSPLRVAGTFTDLLGLTGGDEPPAGKQASVIAFDAGATALSKSARAAVQEVRGELEDDDDLVVVVVHEFSTADLARAAELANPKLDDCRQLSMRLRRKKGELDRERGELAATARMQYAIGDRAAATRSTDRVRALESELGLTENALDRVYELLKPGAERKREARTRAAAFAIAGDRLERVRQAIEDGGVDPKRIEVRQVRVRAAVDDGVRAAHDEGGGRIVLSLRERP